MLAFGNAILLGTTYLIPPPEPGEFVHTGPVSYNWVVPAGVYSICAVGIGRGGNARLSDDGQSSGGGGGGALMYANDIPVTPGEILVLQHGTIRRGATVLIGAFNGYSQSGSGSGGSLNAAGGIPNPAAQAIAWVGYNGGAGRRWSGATRGAGGGAAGYTGNGPSGSSGATRGRNMSLNGPTSNLNMCGGGAGAPNSINGTDGGVRIIWGLGRSYPNNAL